MKRRFSPVGLAVFAVSVGLAGVALAQSFPTHFAPRCAPDEVRIGPAPQDPCEPQFALFGLKGPTTIGPRDVDVETTGAVQADQKGQRPKEK
jgi:hypothetical protein